MDESKKMKEIDPECLDSQEMKAKKNVIKEDAKAEVSAEEIVGDA